MLTRIDTLLESIARLVIEGDDDVRTAERAWLASADTQDLMVLAKALQRSGQAPSREVARAVFQGFAEHGAEHAQAWHALKDKLNPAIVAFADKMIALLKKELDATNGHDNTFRKPGRAYRYNITSINKRFMLNFHVEEKGQLREASVVDNLENVVKKLDEPHGVKWESIHTGAIQGDDDWDYAFTIYTTMSPALAAAVFA